MAQLSLTSIRKANIPVYSIALLEPHAKLRSNTCTVKPVLSSHSKIDKTKVLKTNGSLMKVENFDLH